MKLVFLLTTIVHCQQTEATDLCKNVLPFHLVRSYVDEVERSGSVFVIAVQPNLNCFVDFGDICEDGVDIEITNLMID